MCTNTFLFPDVNALLALVHDVHPHHAVAFSFFSELEQHPFLSTFYLCRFTQLSLLRLLTNRGAMGTDALTMAAAWSAYDRFAEVWKVSLFEEPSGMDTVFRRYTNREEIATNVWADGYLAAFATVAGLQLVTFDKALAKRVKGSVLLTAR